MQINKIWNGSENIIAIFFTQRQLFQSQAPAAINNWITTTFAFDFMLSCHVRRAVVWGQWFQFFHFFFLFPMSSSLQPHRRKKNQIFKLLHSPYCRLFFTSKTFIHAAMEDFSSRRMKFRKTQEGKQQSQCENWLISLNFDSRTKKREIFFYAWHRCGQQASCQPTPDLLFINGNVNIIRFKNI